MGIGMARTLYANAVKAIGPDAMVIADPIIPGTRPSSSASLTQVRRLIDFLPLSNREKPPVRESFDDPDRQEPSLDSLVPANPNKPYDMKELIYKVVDEADFFEISPDWAKNIVCGFARMDGEPIGIVANQPQVLAGVLDMNSARKAARFVRFCDAFKPLGHMAEVLRAGRVLVNFSSRDALRYSCGPGPIPAADFRPQRLSIGDGFSRPSCGRSSIADH